MEKPITISRCPKCKGIIRMAVPKYLEESISARKDFYKEVTAHALTVETLPKEEMLKIPMHFENNCDV